MIKFNKLIIISGNKYSIRTDTVSDIKTVFNKMQDINTSIILVLTYGTDTYHVDLGKLFVDHISLINSTDIFDLIGKLTPEFIYAYETSLFSTNRPIRSFMSYDLSGDVIVSPCNINTGELTNISYDTNFKDMVISCSNFDLTKVIPIIGGKLTQCTWHNKKIFIKDNAMLAEHIDQLTFISLATADVTIKSLVELSANHWNIPNDVVPILVINGSLFYDVPYMYRVDLQQNKIILNNRFILSKFAKLGFTNIAEVINDANSFVILIKAANVFVRDVLMIPVTTDDNVPEFIYYEEVPQTSHIDYICIDNNDYTVCGLMSADDKFNDLVDAKKSYEHHVYADSGNNSLRLIQLTMC